MNHRVSPMTLLIGAVSTVVFCLVWHPAMAWDGTVAGTISSIDVTGGTNQDFRVYFGSQAVCGNATTWAYLNATDPNYATYVATVLMAKALGATVTVYTNRDAAGYCHIGYLQTM